MLGHPDQARQYLNHAMTQLAQQGRPQAPSGAYHRFAQALEEQMVRGTWQA
jgi:hypothetical protein